jgi:AcrR family transcriptional regulator
MDPQERIKNLAQTSFFTQGITPVTMDKLAYELGMSKKTLYQFYQSKDDLLKQLLSEYLSQRKSELALLDKKPQEHIDKLREIWFFGGKTVLELSPLFMNDLKRFHPELWQQVDGFYHDHLFEKMSGILQTCIDRSYIEPKVSKNLLLHVFLRGLHHLPESSQANLGSQASIQAILDLLFIGALTDVSRAMFRHQLTKTVTKDKTFKRVSLDNRD